MDVGAYLTRIGFRGAAEPRLGVLRSLHTCHLLSVPFETLTVHSGGRVRLEPPLLYDKIVKRRRGGFCCENNGLFCWLLRALGFRVRVLSGQVRSLSTGRYGPPFDHMVLMVSLQGEVEGEGEGEGEGRWLCDVGFGGHGFTAPLSLETGAPQEQGHRAYRVREDAGVHFLEWRGEKKGGPDGDWSEIYKFTLDPRRMEDFEEMCRYHQSSPCSVMFCKSFCTVLKPGGRLTYIGRRLISTRFPAQGAGGELETTTRELEEEEIQGVLAEEFGVVLDAPLVPKDDEIAPLSHIY